MTLVNINDIYLWLRLQPNIDHAPQKNAPKPRHNVQFICTRLLMGGLRKIFRTVRICLFAYKIKKTIGILLPAVKRLHFFYFRPSISIPCYLCARSQWIEKCGSRKICARCAFKGIRIFYFELCCVFRHKSTCAKNKTLDVILLLLFPCKIIAPTFQQFHVLK